MPMRKSIDNTEIVTVSILLYKKKIMVSSLIVTINHIWMYTYVSENFIIDLLASDVNCYKKLFPANVKDYLSRIIGRDTN